VIYLTQIIVYFACLQFIKDVHKYLWYCLFITTIIMVTELLFKNVEAANFLASEILTILGVVILETIIEVFFPIVKVKGRKLFLILVNLLKG
jgi:hypothetical protein